MTDKNLRSHGKGSGKEPPMYERAHDMTGITSTYDRERICVFFTTGNIK